jgi:hypothetical protein
MPDESTPRVDVEARHTADSGDPHRSHGFKSLDWSYGQKRRGNVDRRYVARVRWVGGAEGERLRGDLAATVAELLAWAADQQREHGEGAT